ADHVLVRAVGWEREHLRRADHQRALDRPGLAELLITARCDTTELVRAISALGALDVEARRPVADDVVHLLLAEDPARHRGTAERGDQRPARDDHGRTRPDPSLLLLHHFSPVGGRGLSRPLSCREPSRSGCPADPILKYLHRARFVRTPGLSRGCRAG